MRTPRSTTAVVRIRKPRSRCRNSRPTSTSAPPRARDFEKRLKSILSQIKQEPGAVLFIDEIHTIIGAGAASGGVMDASNLIKPMLATGELKCMGSTTYQEFRGIFEKDKALARRFQKIDVPEPSVEETVSILKGLKPNFEAFHDVTYTADALRTAAELSDRYINDRFLPDKAIDVIDEAGANRRLQPASKRKKKINQSDVEAIVAKMARIPEKNGAPPGYVGFDQGGLLTDAVLKNPHAVVLLDEIEKAHPEVFNLLLQVMDHGTLTDNNGRKADFRNVILVMTTNAGAESISRRTLGFVEQDHTTDGMEAINRTFTPEFRNRLDAIVQFDALDASVITSVVDKFVIELESQLADKQIRFDPKMGARPMRRVIQEKIKRPLADEILFGQLAKGGTVKVSVGNDSQLSFEFDTESLPVTWWPFSSSTRNMVFGSVSATTPSIWIGSSFAILRR